jgi:hypothetical protein
MKHAICALVLGVAMLSFARPANAICPTPLYVCAAWGDNGCTEWRVVCGTGGTGQASVAPNICVNPTEVKPTVPTQQRNMSPQHDGCAS